MQSNHDKPEIEEIQELVLKAKNHHKTMSFIALANSIIGVSILSIPFCFQKCGIVLSILLLLISNYITRKCCYFLLKCSIITRRKNFEGKLFLNLNLVIDLNSFFCLQVSDFLRLAKMEKR